MFALYWNNGCKDVVNLAQIHIVENLFGAFLKTIFYNGVRIDVYENVDVHYLAK
jgi:hypothetical protein